MRPESLQSVSMVTTGLKGIIPRMHGTDMAEMESTELTVKNIYEALAHRVDWYELGVCLDVLPPTLDVIKEEENKVSRRTIAMLQKWLSKYPNKGWTDLVDALRKIDKNDVAEDISVKYCDPTVSQTPQCSNSPATETLFHHTSSSTCSTKSKIMSVADVDEFIQELSKEPLEWFKFGVYLGVNEQKLQQIKQDVGPNGMEQCLRELYSIYSHYHGHHPSWGSIVEALRRVGRILLANHIQQKYDTCAQPDLGE